jgi:cyclic AMP-dependent transcription factor ATF-4
LYSIYFYSLELQTVTDKVDFPIDDFVTSLVSAEDLTTNINTDGVKNEQLLSDIYSMLNTVEFSNELTPPQTPPELVVSDLHATLHLELPTTLNNNIPNAHQQQQQQQQYEVYNYQQQTQDEFFYMAECSSGAPSPANEISLMYENSNQSIISSEDNACSEMIFDPDSIISSPADIQRELEVVEELVRAHSRHDYDDDMSVSNASSLWSPRSEHSNSSYSQYDYEPVKKTSNLKGVTKRRTRGYGRNPEEKKSRKKEQNKNAATRYRQKKKQEIGVILDEEKILRDRNRKLTTTFKDTRREVKYLKSLLRDLFKARGFIN